MNDFVFILLVLFGVIHIDWSVIANLLTRVQLWYDGDCDMKTRNEKSAAARKEKNPGKRRINPNLIIQS